MLKKFSVFALLIFTVLIFGLNAFAQSSDESEPAANSKLATINLPSGAERVRGNSVPEEIRTALAKLVAAGGEKIKQGDSEILAWSGAKFNKTNATQLMKKLESELQSGGWEYEIGEKSDEFVIFSLFRTEPQRRLLLGFFVPTDEALVLAMTETLRADAPISDSLSSALSTIQSNPVKTGGNSQGLTGKWAYANTGSMYRNPVSGVTVAGNASRHTYEFFADGTVEYVGIMQTTSLVGCKMEVFSTKKGRFSISGGTMTIAFEPASFSRDDSCDKAGNYKKTLPAETETYNWNVKNENGRILLCMEGKNGESCFDKSN